jgi:hypothetical protein
VEPTIFVPQKINGLQSFRIHRPQKNIFPSAQSCQSRSSSSSHRCARVPLQLVRLASRFPHPLTKLPPDGSDEVVLILPVHPRHGHCRARAPQLGVIQESTFPLRSFSLRKKETWPLMREQAALSVSSCLLHAVMPRPHPRTASTPFSPP